MIIQSRVSRGVHVPVNEIGWWLPVVHEKSPFGEARTRGMDLSAVNLPLLIGQRGRRVDATK